MENSWQGEFRSGETIAGRYVVDDFLGAGGMGWVLKARDELINNQIVALKILYPHLVEDEDSFARFRNEVLVSRRLSHQNIVQVYDFGLSEDSLYLISMEFVDGTTLKDMICNNAQSEFSFEKILDIFFKLCSALDYAHHHYVIHKDLKPDNVLVGKGGEEKIADFGVAQVLRSEGHSTRAGAILGTPCYMSPEQIRGDALDQRSDIYSLGIMAYEMLCRELPFQSPSIYALAQMHQEQPLPEIKGAGIDVPEWFVEIVRGCTEKEIEKRYSSVSKIVEQIAKNAHFTYDAAISGKIPTASPEESGVPAPSLGRDRSMDKFFWLSLPLIFCVIIPSIYLCLSFTNNSVRTFNASNILSFERKYDTELTLLRDFLNIEIAKDDYSSLFFYPEAWENRTLLFSGVDPNITDRHPNVRGIEKPRGDTAGHHLVRNTQHVLNLKVIAAYFDYGLNPNIANDDGEMLLHLAALTKDPALVYEIVKHGGDPNVADSRGNTPLSLAIESGLAENVEILLGAGADPNKPGRSGSPPIIQVAKLEGNSPEIEKMAVLLVKYGANLQTKDGEEKTAYDYNSKLFDRITK